MDPEVLGQPREAVRVPLADGTELPAGPAAVDLHQQHGALAVRERRWEELDRFGAVLHRTDPEPPYVAEGAGGVVRVAAADQHHPVHVRRERRRVHLDALRAGRVRGEVADRAGLRRRLVVEHHVVVRPDAAVRGHQQGAEVDGTPGAVQFDGDALRPDARVAAFAELRHACSRHRSSDSDPATVSQRSGALGGRGGAWDRRGMGDWLAWGAVVVAVVAAVVVVAMAERSLGAAFERRRAEERARLLAQLAAPAAVRRTRRSRPCSRDRGSSRTSAGHGTGRPRPGSATGGTTSRRCWWSTTRTG